eukprot:2329236-Alexandrium_andersonii.AAC.1
MSATCSPKTSSVPRAAARTAAGHATCGPPPASLPPGTDGRALVASRLPLSTKPPRTSLVGRRLGEQRWHEGGQRARAEQE